MYHGYGDSHFSCRFTAEHPGKVFAKKSVAAEEVEVTLARRPQQQFQVDGPHVIQAKGLSATRRKYLHDVVRKYVHPAHQDDLCPP